MFDYGCTYIYVLVYACLYIYGMNDCPDTRDGKEELGLFGYYKVLTLSEKQYSVTSKWNWTICKSILQTLEQQLKTVKKKKKEYNQSIY